MVPSITGKLVNLDTVNKSFVPKLKLLKLIYTPRGLWILLLLLLQLTASEANVAAAIAAVDTVAVTFAVDTSNQEYFQGSTSSLI